MKAGDNFALICGLFQVFMMVMIGCTCDYNEANPSNVEEYAENINRVARVYPMFQDVHVMIFIGFGFLMTFPKTYSWSAVGYNFFISAIIIQWSIIMHGFVSWSVDGYHKIMLHAETLIKGDFAAGAVLISFGAVLGRVTPTQLFVMGVFEIIFYSINEHIGVVDYEAVDMGGSIFVHTFGAYFGLAVSWALGAPKKDAKNDDKSDYKSDLFAMIGTIFLWMYWPSFNGALCPVENFQRERVVINTVLALCASCVVSFAASRFLTHEQKFDMVHIQNATLAGGVAVGSSSDLVIGPWSALLIGSIAGLLSVVGYVYISDFLREKIGLHDTCGVHNLHGMPGVMGGIGGAISAAVATENSYGAAISEIFAGRENRTSSEQGWYQAAALVTAMAFAIVGGLLTGFILKQPALFVQEETPFGDQTCWELPGGEEEHVHKEAEPLKSEDVGVEMTGDKKESEGLIH